MTEMVGYNGPIYMTQPTLAIAPILLEDMRRVAVERKGETNFFTSQMIKDCMKKVIAVNLHQGEFLLKRASSWTLQHFLISLLSSLESRR